MIAKKFQFYKREWGWKVKKLWKQVRDQGNKLENGNKLKMRLKVY